MDRIAQSYPLLQFHCASCVIICLTSLQTMLQNLGTCMHLSMHILHVTCGFGHYARPKAYNYLYMKMPCYISCIYTYVFVCVKIYSHICLLNSALVLYRPRGLNSVYLKLKSHRYINGFDSPLVIK